MHQGMVAQNAGAKLLIISLITKYFPAKSIISVVFRVKTKSSAT